MRTRTILGVAVVFAGVIVVAYPHLRAAYFEYTKDRLLDRWEQTVVLEETPLHSNNPESTNAISNTDGNSTPYDRPDSDIWHEDTNIPFNTSYVLENMEGVIIINKINLKYPILRDVTEYNLNFAICVVSGSPEIGAEGNYCLAGHKSRIYGRQFNRLPEIKIGDNVMLSNGKSQFNYIVAETMHVSPEDTWVLDDVVGKKLLTLITCDYTVTPIGRFIVKCELMD